MASCCKHWSTMRTSLPSPCRNSWQICSAIGAASNTRTTLCAKASRPCSKSSPNGASRQKSSSQCNSRWNRCGGRTKDCTLKCTIYVSRPSQSSTPTSLPQCTTRMTMLHESLFEKWGWVDTNDILQRRLNAEAAQAARDACSVIIRFIIRISLVSPTSFYRSYFVLSSFLSTIQFPDNE